MKGIKDNSFDFRLRNSMKVGAPYRDKEGLLRNQIFQWMVVVVVLQGDHKGQFQKGTKVTKPQSMEVLQRPKSFTFYPPDAVYPQYATDIPDMGGLPFLLGKQISQTVLYTSMKNIASFQFSSVIFQDIL